jgi:hypothetical protein
MKKYFQQTTSAAPLAVFRIAFGMLLFASVVRFWANGWIYDLYIKPKYFFPFFGFEFVKPLGEWTYLLFAVCAICALLVAVGYYYRIAIAGLFLTFTYIELIDKSTYLNHYYFISMICLMMIFLPAHVYFSVDSSRNKNLLSNTIPRWSLDALKFFVCVVYLYAGLAKVNSDWLIHAQPLRIWLPAKNDLPLIGSFFNHLWVAYAFSWVGCIYDLSIPFLLLNRSTRAVAYVAVIVFHLLTAVLFPIGMFPYIMIVTALIFFSGTFHQRILSRISRWLNVSEKCIPSEKTYQPKPLVSAISCMALTVILILQLSLPLRHALYPGELFWTEEGYRFSWRVMLIEKAGFAQFTVKDTDGKTLVVDNSAFLTPLQEKMVATQPDMILQYAHILKKYYSLHGFHSPEVYVDSYVALNGRLGKPMIDSRIDLSKEKESFRHKPWILPFDHDIKGF